MSITVCIFASTLYYPDGGGHFWVYLNWALGLRALGCRVIWMEAVYPGTAPSELRTLVTALKEHLNWYGLSGSVALTCYTGEPLPREMMDGCLGLDSAAEADLLLDMSYEIPDKSLRHFRRTALVDLDPGLSQIWMSTGQLPVAKHDYYFTIGETVGRPEARFPDLGLQWFYTPPCVALEWWPTCEAPEPGAPFSTVTQWNADEWVEWGGEIFCNNKREGFLPFLELPRHTSQTLELALGIGDGDEEDCTRMHEAGWSLRDVRTVTATPAAYQSYLQRSRGEFSCVKPSCVRLQNAWMSDRTICYMASGKPAVVQNTGPSRFLPKAAGLFRFETVEDAARCLETVAADYGRHCRLARALVEEYFNARKNLAVVLERGLN